MSTKQRYDRSDIRRLNVVSVLDQLRANGAMSRAKIATALGLTRATVSNIATDLLNASLIRETEYDQGDAGRPGLLLNLNPNSGSMIAVDIDVDRISVVLANVGMETLWREEMALPGSVGADQALSQVVDLVDQALELGRSMDLPCRGICVAWAGLVKREDGRLEYGPTSGWQHVPLKSDWESRFGVSVHVENEAHVGAIWAHHFGPRPGAQNLVYLSVGAGLASGVFVDGVLLRGKQGFAGQVGHTFFADNGVKCSCGKYGCWVTEIGAAAVQRKLLEAGVPVPDAGSGRDDWIAFAVERAEEGDAEVLQILSSVAAQLGSGLASLVQTVNPSIIVVGGRLAGLMTLVDSEIREALMAATLPYMAEDIQLVISQSEDDRLRGCLALVFDQMMKHPPIAIGRV